MIVPTKDLLLGSFSLYVIQAYKAIRKVPIMMMSAVRCCSDAYERVVALRRGVAKKYVVMSVTHSFPVRDCFKMSHRSIKSKSPIF
jgi:hypothetical protein